MSTKVSLFGRALIAALSERLLTETCAGDGQLATYLGKLDAYGIGFEVDLVRWLKTGGAVR